MTTEHPITPPPELFAKCYEQAERQLQSDFPLKFAMSCAIRTAYAAGADAELEACCKWTSIVGGAEALRTARRPRPPSLAEEALKAQQRAWNGRSTHADWELIRAALERLQELEKGNE